MNRVRVLVTLLTILVFVLAACSPAGEGTEAPLETPLTGVETELPEATEVLPGTGLETPTVEMTEEPLETETVEESPTAAPTEAATATAPTAATEEVLPGTGAAIVPAQLTRLMDFEVQNPNGDTLGDVNDMILDLGAAQVSHIVMGAGGFLGIGERDIPIPWDSARVSLVDPDTNQCVFIVDVSNETLQNVPDFDPNAVDFSSPDWSTEFDDYWNNITDTGVAPANDTATGTPGASDADTTATGTPAAGDADETVETTVGAADISACFIEEMTTTETLGTEAVTPGVDVTGEAATEVPPVDGAESTAAVTPATGGTGAAATGTPGSDDTGPTMTAAPVEGFLLASDLLGYTITDSQGENVGHVEDAIINLANDSMSAAGSDQESGQITYIVMEVDAAVDIADDWVLLPVEALNQGAEEGQFSINMSVDELNSVPSYPAGELPLQAGEDWDQEVRDFWADMTS